MVRHARGSRAWTNRKAAKRKLVVSRFKQIAATNARIFQNRMRARITKSRNAARLRLAATRARGGARRQFVVYRPRR